MRHGLAILALLGLAGMADAHAVMADRVGGDGDAAFQAAGHYPSLPVDCPDDGVPEGEPTLFDGYTDNHNAGCGGLPPSWNVLFEWRTAGSECGWLCGRGGWYLSAGSGQLRDTDWYPVTAGGTSMTMQVWAAEPCNILVLNACYPSCSPPPQVLYHASTGGDWGDATLTWVTTPGEQFVLWVGSPDFTPPGGGTLGEFDYVMKVCGHQTSIVDAPAASWGSVKSRFR